MVNFEEFDKLNLNDSFHQRTIIVILAAAKLLLNVDGFIFSRCQAFMTKKVHVRIGMR